MSEDRPRPTCARQIEPTPYRLPEWPARVGFTYEPQSGCWVRDSWTLKREGVKCWRLSHPDRESRRVVTGRRHAEAIALDLAWQVRELVEPA